MAKFNKPVKQANQTPDTVNLAGGTAFSQTAELELLSTLVTSFAADKFYEKADQTFSRISSLLERVSPLFAAKTAVFARRKFGMRSISHYTAAALAKRLTGEQWASAFYNAIVNRPDDMLEIAAIFMQDGGKLPNAAKKGFAQAFGRFDSYQLAKYRGEGKAVKLVDLVNIVHPKPNERNSEALKALISGNLKNEATWEAMLSKAGQEDEAQGAKADAWAELVNSGRMPYFALLRNLRNIVQQNPQLTGKICNLLRDPEAIKRSLVLPFRYTTAYNEIGKLPQDRNTREIMEAISRALDISCSNVPLFNGNTLVVLDVSGSMGSKGEPKSPAGIGGLFAAVLCKALKCDLMFFANNAIYQNYEPTQSALGIFNGMKFNGGGTNFHSIFQAANRPYDRVILLSDMQGWIGTGAPIKEFAEYKLRYGADPFIYSFDLQGYGTMQFPESKVFCLAGFSEKVFDVMSLLENTAQESDRAALVSEINKIDFSDFN